jgi:hypothetical protein
MSKIVEIIVFDAKKMFNGGKVELTNVADQNIKIRSISAWKTRKISHLQYPE